MEYLLIALLAIAAWHAVYEGIIAPTIRMRLRFSFFEIRDELRLLKIEAGLDLGDQPFILMEEYINNAIKLMARITFSEVMSAQKMLTADADLLANVSRRTEILDSCKLDEFQALRTRIAQVFAQALAVNSGGWAIYVLPLLLVWYLTTRLAEAVRGILTVPGNRVDQIFGNPGVA